MTSSALVRIGALAAIAGGGLLLVGELWSLLAMITAGETGKFSEFAATSSWSVVTAMYLIGALLLLVALVGLYARQSEEVGALGVAGFLAALISTGLLVGMMWMSAFVVPTLALEVPAFLNAEQLAGPLDAGLMFSGVAVGVGWALFGVATLRAGVFPRVATIVLTVGAVLAFLPLPASHLILEAAAAWMGYVILAEGSESVGRAATVR
jgi:hypothetical protein